MAKLLIVVGLLLLLAGLLWYFLGDHLSWIGRLPGDIRIERQNYRFYFPLTTMILFSILLSVLLAVLRRFF